MTAKIEKQTTKPAAAKVVNKGKVDKQPQVVAAAPVQRSAGRPISEAQVKVRRRVVAFIEKQTEEFTVKQVAKALKVSRMHVSNAMRWADTQKIVKKVGYKEEKRAGRKELLFLKVPAVQPEPITKAKKPAATKAPAKAKKAA